MTPSVLYIVNGIHDNIYHVYNVCNIQITPRVEVKKQRNHLGVKGTASDILPSKTHYTQFTKNARGVLDTIAQVQWEVASYKV